MQLIALDNTPGQEWVTSQASVAHRPGPQHKKKQTSTAEVFLQCLTQSSEQCMRSPYIDWIRFGSANRETLCLLFRNACVEMEDIYYWHS